MSTKPNCSTRHVSQVSRTSRFAHATLFDWLISVSQVLQHIFLAQCSAPFGGTINQPLQRYSTGVGRVSLVSGLT